MSGIGRTSDLSMAEFVGLRGDSRSQPSTHTTPLHPKISTGLAMVGSIIAGLLAAAGVIVASHKIQSERSQFVDPNRAQAAVAIFGLAFGVFISILFLASLIAFIFSVLLCNGICNRRPGQVKAYFIYGVVITVLAVLASVADLCIQDEAAVGLVGLLGCVIYSLFLLLVHKTYAKLLEGAVFKGHMRLVES